MTQSVLERSALDRVSQWLAGSASTVEPPFPELAVRQNIFDMTRQAQKAVLVPAEPGAWPHAMRAALAARIAARNGNAGLAAIYTASLQNTPEAALAEPDFAGRDTTEQKLLAFMDRVANDTRTVTPSDISTLQQAGIADADIVRLCELNAFLAYQIRVIAGLASMVQARDGEGADR